MDEADWTYLMTSITTVFDANMKLLDATPDMTARLNEARIKPIVKEEKVEDAEDPEAVEDIKPFLMYHVALFARRKALLRSGREQMVCSTPLSLLLFLLLPSLLSPLLSHLGISN